MSKWKLMLAVASTTEQIQTTVVQGIFGKIPLKIENIRKVQRSNLRSCKPKQKTFWNWNKTKTKPGRQSRSRKSSAEKRL